MPRKFGNHCLLLVQFCDAVKEGDGDRVIRVWKYLMLLYRASKRINYAFEAFTLLLEYHVSLAPQFAEQLKWSRFINVHGRPGRNISCDLHMEHLNRIAKTAVDGLGANKTEKAIDRVGKTVGTLTETLEMFDKENHVGEESGAHTNKSSVKDMSKILEELLKMDVFKKEPGRKHNSFQNLKPNLIKTLDEGQLNEWMYQHSTNVYYTHIHV